MRRTYFDLLALAAEPVAVGAAKSPASAPANQQPAAGSSQQQPAGGSSPRAIDADTFGEKAICDSLSLDVLGVMDGGKVKVFSRYHRRTEIIPDVGRLKYEHLLQLAGPPVRSRVVEVMGDELPAGTWTLRDVKRAVAMLAGFRKITDGTEVGAGCWYGLDTAGNPSDSVVVVGSNEAADWNGDKTLRRIEHPISRGRLLNFDQESRNWYEFDGLRELMGQASDAAFRRAAMNDCINLFGRWRWKNQTSSPIILTGLIFATWVQTLWEWRPQVSVIGPTSSGKSMLCKAIASIFGSLAKSCSDSTAAGIRQLIENSARIILFDEFDAEDKRQAEEQQKILKMLRASGRGDAVVRGSSGQKAVEFTLRHIVWLLGIQISSPREADRNRYILAELLPPTKEKRGQLVVPPQEWLHNLGQRMLATAIYSIHEARKLAIKIKDTQIAGVADRVVESHSVPAAMLAVIEGEGEVVARQILQEMLAPIASEGAAVGVSATDEQSLMSEILSAQVQVGPNRRSVGQLVENVIRLGSGHDADRETLESKGLKIGRFSRHHEGKLTGEPCFMMAHGAISEHLIKNTKWGGQAIDQILKRLPSAHYSRRRIGGQLAYNVAIPLGCLMREFLGLDEAGSELEALAEGAAVMAEAGSRGDSSADDSGSAGGQRVTVSGQGGRVATSVPADNGGF